MSKWRSADVFRFVLEERIETETTRGESCYLLVNFATDGADLSVRIDQDSLRRSRRIMSAAATGPVGFLFVHGERIGAAAELRMSRYHNVKKTLHAGAWYTPTATSQTN